MDAVSNTKNKMDSGQDSWGTSWEFNAQRRKEPQEYGDLLRIFSGDRETLPLLERIDVFPKRCRWLWSATALVYAEEGICLSQKRKYYSAGSR